MADVTLLLDGKPQKATLSTTTLQRVVIPAGTVYLQVGSGAPFYEEVSTAQTLADAAAVTAADQMLWQAGTYACPVLVTPDGQPLKSPRPWYMYFAGSAASQPLHLRALSGQSQ